MPSMRIKIHFITKSLFPHQAHLITTHRKLVKYTTKWVIFFGLMYSNFEYGTLCFCGSFHTGCY